ncbi:MAG TPA: hypothetical protein PK894_03815 [Defluviitoga sp.]|nr:hypothetical protein [Defluviitoga sp.]HOP24457.1 hypothetical protein [Defluviitoga sp.]HPZ28706.1 hypothetical protein [Defluviitoga sp.]HQD62708.1 hypothetical protein [Defluviitoga sp.]
MISLKEKLILKTLHKKFNNQIPTLFSEIAYKGKEKYLFFVFVDKSSELAQKTMYEIIKSDDSITFVLQKNEKEYQLNVEKISDFKSYYYVEMDESCQIHEFVEFIK